MSVTIHLDRPHSHFTNLDILSGRVVLHLTSEAAVSGIQVKLEGESRTRLVGPRHAYADRSDKKRAELEVHKVRFSKKKRGFASLMVTSPDESRLVDSVQSRVRLPYTGDPRPVRVLHICTWHVRVSVPVQGKLSRGCMFCLHGLC